MANRNYVIYLIISLLVIASLAYTIYLGLSDIETDDELFLSTTTSIENTGLLDYLIEKFERRHSFNVKYTAVGSGAAIQLARDGEVDAILVHAPALELELIEDGFADVRNTLWYNYFIFVGPASDPANISRVTKLDQVMVRLYEAGKAGEAHFYSRGDQSGTHLKELSLWANSSYSIDPEAEKDWYKETPGGMTQTLTTTNNDKIGYTLTDLGTYATIQGSQTPLDLIKVYEADDLLYNPYSYLIINSDVTHTKLNTAKAKLFLEFLQDPTTAELVVNYTVGDIVLFTPIATETQIFR